MGGGPVGLWTANILRIMAINNNINIVVLEKRYDYVREHLLNLKKESFLVPEITEDNPHYNKF